MRFLVLDHCPKFFKTLLLGLLGCSLFLSLQALSDTSLFFELQIDWLQEGKIQPLKTWKINELKSFAKKKALTSIEKDPHTNQKIKWQGIRLSELLNHTLRDLSPENRAQIDLVILDGSGLTNPPVMIPRFIINRYPFLAAILPKQDSRGSLYLVAPWTSQPALLKETLPIEEYFGSIHKIRLTNTAEYYQSLFLKNRKDPLAIRGEKVFIQACTSCHDFNTASSLPKNPLKSYLTQSEFFSSKNHSHPLLRITQKDHQALLRYFSNFEGENGASALNTRFVKPGIALQSKAE